MGQRFGQLSEFRDRQWRYRRVGYGRTSLTVFVPIPSMLMAPRSFAFLPHLT